MNKKLLALFSLKFNPFSPEVPTTALFVSPPVEDFCWRVEQQIGEGGLALVSGEPGTGKSVTLRILAARLSNLWDVSLGVLTRPQATTLDFYRELGHLFQVPLSPNNRWNSARALREKWLAPIESSLARPALIMDEAQEMNPSVFCELRLLSSAELDSRHLLCVILAGDSRLSAHLHQSELLPIASRIRTRLRHDPASPQQLREGLVHLLKEAGNPRLMSEAVIVALAEHAAGNFRVLTHMANDLLALAVRREADQIDEKLFFEAFDPKAVATPARRKNPS